MENSKSSLDKNLLISIILPILFILGFYIYYQIDIYYSNKLFQERFQEETAINTESTITDYKMVYTLKFPPENYPKITKYGLVTLPAGTTNYKGERIYGDRPAELHVYEACESESGNKIDSYITFSEAVGEAPEGIDYITVNHYAYNQLYIYDFNLKIAYPVECTSLKKYGLNYLASYQGIGMSRSPDGLVIIKKIDPQLVSRSPEDGLQFPYLLPKVIESISMSTYNDYESYKENYSIKDTVIVNGEVVSTDSLIVDPVNNRGLYSVFNDSEFRFIGWAR